jgi:hypothetical protein
MGNKDIKIIKLTGDYNPNRSKKKDRYDASDRHWGEWYLSKSEPISLNIYPYPNNGAYEIELVRINSPVKVLSWMTHLMEKNWMAKKDFEDFMVACRTLQEEGLTPPGQEKEESSWGYW